jgi:Tfp pilus assembly protein PilO
VTARLASLSTRAQVALVAAVLLLVAVLGYFALISPKRSDAASLKKQTAAVQAQIDANQSTAFQQALPAVRSASIFSLAQAMPSQLDTPNIILELNQLAAESGITFDKVAPTAASTTSTTTTDPFATQPIDVQFTGSFYDLLTFLQRLRNLVRAQNGDLYTAGRLYDVSSVSFAEGPNTWPQIQASLTINAFVSQSASTAAPGTTDTTSTTTGTTTNPTSAAPSTSGGTS